MKPNRIRQRDVIARRKHQRGISLVVVLGCVVFLSALILAFLSGARTELRTSKLYADGSSVRLLAQSAVNIVTAEITEATRARDGNTALTWASQPGMIRSYSDSGTTIRQWYKLYSSVTMTGSEAFDPNSNDEAVPTNWSDQPAVFTDLNQPVTVKGVDYYPVIDGNNLVNVSGTKTYDSDSDGVPDVQGFYVKNSAPLASGTDANPVPMPVRWLYVLANGKVVAPTAGGNGSTVAISGASEDNPIVGRMAFWTDDETGKININTAAEGTYWDTPRIASQQDYNLSNAQPAQREFQRYPGHPAMVALSTVFSKPAGMADQDWKEEIYGIAPRVSPGGSKGGTVVLNSSAGALASGTSRLYVSVDELLFKPVMSNDNRQENDPQVLNKTTLNRANFFLTASSRAPDLNLFGLPRVCIWPITLNKTTNVPAMTPYDALIAFCTTIRGAADYPFYFQRLNANDPKADLPDTGGLTGVARNRTILEYLRTLTGKNIPGFGGSFQQKYSTKNPNGSGTDCDQVLTEIFDYIRSTNLRDSSSSSSYQYAQALNSWGRSPGLGQVVPILDSKGNRNTKGFGRFPTVYSVALHFIGVADDTTNPEDITNGATVVVPKVGKDKIRVQAACYVQMFDPSQGVVLCRPIYRYQVEGLNNFAWNGTSMGFGSPVLLSWPTVDTNPGITFIGGLQDFRMFNYAGFPVSARTGYTGQAADMPKGGTFSFAGGPLTIKIYNVKGDGSLNALIQTVNVNFPSATFPVPGLAPGNIQVAHTSPKPSPVNYRTFVNLSGDNLYATGTTGVATTGRFNANMTLPPITSSDVVESVVVAGDPRLVAAQQTVPADFFTTHPNYGTLNQFAHILRAGFDAPFYGASGGKLVNLSSPSYSGYEAQHLQNNVEPVNSGTAATEMAWGKYVSKEPDVPTSTGVTTSEGLPGDWDTGIGNERDGAFINKADEGDVSTNSSSGALQAYFGLDYNDALVGVTFFSPNRLIPSAGVFGSLPSEVFANRPWQTLLFRPGPRGHRGLDSPPDYLLLDLFHMPVVEPYAISEPLSTAGRINMNYQIVPFTYINRDTGIRAVLKSEMVVSIPDAKADKYKTNSNVAYPGAPFDSTTYRWNINMAATLQQFQQRFDSGDIFHSAAEICSVDLVPDDGVAPSNPTRDLMDNYWNTHRLTGDNLREKTYANIYPLLTTQSNTYTVHMRVQTLKKSASGNAGEWDETRDKITGEFRGSQTIERYVDPNDRGLVDYADPSNSNQTLDGHYHFRVVNAKQFSP
ncbi:MAG: Verru_Chthon cassette protein A [Verrucomicrobiales bacterium]|jgi:uncharacterized protein (TIGR02600 family)|nr:Verru_Chthon cassette protein A [Verrucomicrobiales bacterium]